MALEKTWQYASNVPYPVTDTIENQSAWYVWWIKQCITGAVPLVDQSGAAVAAPQGLWTVAGSSDGVTGGMDGVDRWNDSSKIIKGASSTDAHSWVCLANAALGIWMVWDVWKDAYDNTLSFWISTTAPTGGSATSAPSAARAYSYAGIGSSSTRGQPYCDVIPGAGFVHGTLATDGSFLTFESRSAKGKITSSMGALRLADTQAGDMSVIAGIEELFYSNSYESFGAWMPIYSSTATDGDRASLLYSTLASAGWATFSSIGADKVQAIVPYALNNPRLLGAWWGNTHGGRFRKQDFWTVLGSTSLPHGRIPDVFLTQPGIGDGAVALDENGNIELCQVGTVMVPAYTALSV